MKKIIFALLLCSVCFTLSARDIFVAQDGDDDNPGTIDMPLATLAEAFERSIRCNTEGVTIYMRGGLYSQSGPLRLNEGHSGRPDALITVKPYNGEEVRISGGMRIENWTFIGGGVYVADVPQGVYFRQLYINDQMAIKARYPNYQKDLGVAYSNTSGLKMNVTDNDLGSSGLSPEDFAGCEVYARKRWAGTFVRVERVEDFSGTGFKVIFDGPSAVAEGRALSFWNQAGNKPKVCFRDSRAFLDVENEWYLDREESKVYFIPPAGIDPNQSYISAPTFQGLFKFEGLNYVNFQGLILEQSGHFPRNDIYATLQGGGDYTRRTGPGGAFVTSDTLSPSGIELRNCSNIVFERNIIRNHGGGGIGFPQPCDNVTVQGNAIYCIGGSAVQGHLNWDVRKDVALPETSENLLIADNYMVNLGTEIFSGNGITFYGLHHSTIRNNTIIAPIYTGMHFGVNYLINKKFPLNEKRGIDYVGDLKILHNYVDKNQSYNYDGGGIHTLGFMTDTVLMHGNVVDFDAFQCGIRCHNEGPSIYLDNSSTNVVLSNNLAEGKIGVVNRVNDLTGSQNVSNKNSWQKFLFHQEEFGLFLTIRPKPNWPGETNFNVLTSAQQEVLDLSGVRPEYHDMESFLPGENFRVFEILRPGNRYEY